MIDPIKMNPIKIADFKAILEKLEADGHTEIEEIILEWEYSCDELPDVDVKDGKVYMYFHDTWTEKKHALIKAARKEKNA